MTPIPQVDDDVDYVVSFRRTDFDVEFTALAEERDYNAVLTFQTSVGDISFNLEASAVPEPSTLAMAVFGTFGAVLTLRRRRTVAC